jgi:hypothetical protein
MMRPWQVLKDWRLAWVLVASLGLQAALMALTIPHGYAPDEAAHLAYIRDSAQGWLPDYAAGKLPDGRPNYLAHPPLYYGSLGLLARIGHWQGPAAMTVMRLASTAYMLLGLVFAVLAARRLGVQQAYVAIALLACAAVPMFSYQAGSVSNDTLLYLGVNMMFYGMACRVTVTPSRQARDGLAWLYGGIAIVMLTKATGATFVLFTLLGSALLGLRRPAEWWQRWVDLRWLGALMLVVGGYYAYAVAVYGTPFPKPGELYPDAPVPAPMAFTAYALEFFKSMWRRLPVVMSHLSLAPIPESLRGVFYFMVTLPLAGWLVVRFSPALSNGQTALIRATDAAAFGAMATVALHLTLGYQGYLRNGVLGGFQPRYYAYLIPLAWCAFFAICRPGWFRSTLATLFAASALVIFWASVPLTQWRQQEAAQAIPQSFTPQALPDARSLSVDLQLRGSATGNVDEYQLERGVLFARGWVFDMPHQRPVQRLWVHFGPRYVTSIKVQAPRPDVARALGLPQAARSGFALRFGGLPSDLQRCDVVLLAEYADGSFGELPVPDCPPR